MVHYPPGPVRPGLAQAGLLPDRVIYIEAGDEKSVLVCFEEGLRHGGLGAVVAEVARGRGGRFRPADGIHHPLADHRPPRNPIAGAWRWDAPAGSSIRGRAGESADFEVAACDPKGRLALPSRLVHTDRLRRTLGGAAPPDRL